MMSKKAADGLVGNYTFSASCDHPELRAVDNTSKASKAFSCVSLLDVAAAKHEFIFLTCL